MSGPRVVDGLRVGAARPPQPAIARCTCLHREMRVVGVCETPVVNTADV